MRISETAEALHQVGHFERNQCRLGPLVPVFSTRAVDGLFQCIGSDNAVRDRHPGLEGGLGDTFGGFARDIVKVRRLAANDAAEANHGREPLGFSQSARDQRNLPSAGDAHLGNLIGGNSVANEGFDRPAGEAARNEVVEAGHYQGDADTRASE